MRSYIRRNKLESCTTKIEKKYCFILQTFSHWCRMVLMISMHSCSSYRSRIQSWAKVSIPHGFGKEKVYLYFGKAKHGCMLLQDSKINRKVVWSSFGMALLVCIFDLKNASGWVITQITITERLHKLLKGYEKAWKQL